MTAEEETDEGEEVEELLGRAHESLAEGDASAAEAICSSALQASPSCAAAFALRSRARGLLGEAAGAEADAGEALALDPSDGELWCWRAALRLGTGDVAGAESDASEAFARGAEIGSALRIRAAARYARGDWSGSTDDCTLAIEASPMDAGAWATRAAEDILLEDFCCAAEHNEYCWGPQPVTQASAPSAPYARCCFQRLARLLQEPPATWAAMQVARELRSASRRCAEAPPGAARRPLPRRLCRLGIREGGQEVEVSCGDRRRAEEPIVTALVRAIRLLSFHAELPRLDLLLSTHELEEEPDPAGGAPVLAYSRRVGSRGALLLMPMWEQLTAWARKSASAAARAAAARPWGARRPLACFRGAESGCRRPGAASTGAAARRPGFCDPWTTTNWPLWPRARLARFSRDHPDLVDAKIVSRFAHHRHLRTAFELRNLTGPAVSIEEQLRCRWLLDVDGTTQSNRLLWALASGSLVLKQRSPAAAWCSAALRPWRHFVPLRADLSDLRARLAWASGHDAAARAIGERAQGLALGELGLEPALRYLHHLLGSLAEWEGNCSA